MRKLRLLLRYELNFWFNKLNVHAKDGKSAFIKLFPCFSLKSESVLSLWLRSLCFKYFCKKEKVQVKKLLPPLMFIYWLLAIYCLGWPCDGLHVAMNYWRCVSNFVSSWLANRQCHFKQANHGAYSNPSTQQGSVTRISALFRCFICGAGYFISVKMVYKAKGLDPRAEPPPIKIFWVPPWGGTTSCDNWVNWTVGSWTS